MACGGTSSASASRSRYSVYLEGTSDKVRAHQQFIEYFETAFGHVTDLEVMNDHDRNAFNVNSSRVFRPV